MFIESGFDYDKILKIFFTNLVVLLITFIGILTYLIVGIIYLIEYFEVVKKNCSEMEIWFYILIFLGLHIYFYVTIILHLYNRKINKIIIVNILLGLLCIIFGIYELFLNDSDCINIKSFKIWDFGIVLFIINLLFLIVFSIICK